MCEYIDVVQYATYWMYAAETNNSLTIFRYAFWNPDFHYRAHLSTTLFRVFRQNNPFNIPTSSVSWKSILISLSHICLYIPNCLFPYCITTKILFPSLLTANSPNGHFHLIFFHWNKYIICSSTNTWISPSCSLLHITPNDCSCPALTLNTPNCNMYSLCNKNQEV